MLNIHDKKGFIFERDNVRSVRHLVRTLNGNKNFTELSLVLMASAGEKFDSVCKATIIRQTRTSLFRNVLPSSDEKTIQTYVTNWEL